MGVFEEKGVEKLKNYLTKIFKVDLLIKWRGTWTRVGEWNPEDGGETNES